MFGGKNHSSRVIEGMSTSKCTAHPRFSSNAPRGVLGGTYALHGVPHKGKCNSVAQGTALDPPLVTGLTAPGGCMVPFPSATYFVPNQDLLGTKWYSQLPLPGSPSVRARSVYMDGEHLAVHNVRSKAPVVGGSVEAAPHSH